MTQEKNQLVGFIEAHLGATLPTTRSGWETRKMFFSEEKRVGRLAYDRLLPDVQKYSDICVKNVGEKSWLSSTQRYQVVEARSIVLFLSEWLQREGRLTYLIEECDKSINALAF